MLLYSTALAAGPRWQEQPMPPGWRVLLDSCQVQDEAMPYCNELHYQDRVGHNSIQIPLGWRQQDNALALELGTDWYSEPTLPYAYEPAGLRQSTGRFSYFGLVAASGMEIRLGLDSRPTGWQRGQHTALFLHVSNPW
jgi:hypothetical protein